MTKRIVTIRGTRDMPPTALQDPPKLRLEPELHRLLVNWVQCRAGGMSISKFMAYQGLLLKPGGPGAYQPPYAMQVQTLPELKADADRVQRAVDALEPRERTVIVVWWVHGGSVRQKAKQIGCRSGTLYQVLEIAHAKLRAKLVGVREPITEGKPA